MKHIKLILFLCAIIAIAVLLILNEFLVYGVILVGIAFAIYSSWILFIRKHNEAIAERDAKIALSESLIQELEQKKINISQITAILELGLMEIDSSFTRVYNRQYNEGKRKFFGALKVDIIAKYGIDIKELRFKCENNKIIVYNLTPKFLSFAHRECTWQIIETMELVERNKFTKLMGAENYWRTKSHNDSFTLQESETIRLQTEKELENGIEELKWIEKPLQNQALNVLKTLLFPDMEICISDYCDDSFVDISNIQKLTCNTIANYQ